MTKRVKIDGVLTHPLAAREVASLAILVTQVSNRSGVYAKSMDQVCPRSNKMSVSSQGGV